MEPDIQNSVTRTAAHDVVLCIQETTELDFNGQMASGFSPFLECCRRPNTDPLGEYSINADPLQGCVVVGVPGLLDFPEAGIRGRQLTLRACLREGPRV